MIQNIYAVCLCIVKIPRRSICARTHARFAHESRLNVYQLKTIYSPTDTYYIRGSGKLLTLYVCSVFSIAYCVLCLNVCFKWTFKELSTLTKYTRLGRLPEGKSQVKRFGVSIHHANTAI